MPTTPILLLPYPSATDPADVPTDMGELANRIETVRGSLNGLASLDATGRVPAAQLRVVGGTRMEQIVTQSIPNAAWTALTFATGGEDDVLGIWTSAQPSRFTFTSVGWYQISGGVELNGNATGSARHLALYRGGAPGTGVRLAAQSGIVHATNTARIMLSTLVHITGANTILELYVYQDSGAALGTSIGSAEFRDTHFAAIQMSTT